MKDKNILHLRIPDYLKKWLKDYSWSKREDMSKTVRRLLEEEKGKLTNEHISRKTIE